MYALIYDDHDPTRPLKRVISTHRYRKTAEKALQKRMKRLGIKRPWECYTRIVWVDGHAKANDFLSPSIFFTWRDGEEIPWGELYSDAD